jgi:hypothetical protein
MEKNREKEINSGWNLKVISFIFDLLYYSVADGRSHNTNRRRSSSALAKNG